MITKPFIHKFQTDKSNYIYDVNTNEIVSVSDLEYEFVDHFDHRNPESLLKLFKEKYSQNEIVDTWRIIKGESINLNILSTKRPLSLNKPLCDKHFHHKLNNQLDQLVLNVTNQCNLRCKYCSYSGIYHDNRKHSSDNMDISIALKALKLFISKSKESEEIHVSFYGGEPLLNYEVVKKSIEYVKKNISDRKCSFYLDTNATLLKLDIIKFLVKNRIYLQVSIDGPQAIHDYYRVYQNGNKSFNKIIDNLKLIKNIDSDYYNSRVSFAITVAPPYDLLAIKTYFDKSNLTPYSIKSSFVNEKGCDFEYTFSNELNNSKLHESLELLTNTYIKEKSKTTKDVKSRFLSDFYLKSMLQIHRRERSKMNDYEKPNGICVPGQRRLFVDVNGKFYMCERIGEFGELGDVNSGIDPSKIKRLIDEYIYMSNKDCCECWAVRLCGMCFTTAVKNKKYNVNWKRLYCNDHKSAINSQLIHYSKIMELNPNAFEFVKDMVFS